MNQLGMLIDERCIFWMGENELRLYSSQKYRCVLGDWCFCFPVCDACVCVKKRVQKTGCWFPVALKGAPELEEETVASSLAG